MPLLPRCRQDTRWSLHLHCLQRHWPVSRKERIENDEESIYVSCIRYRSRAFNGTRFKAARANKLAWPSRAEQRQSQVQYTVSGTFAKNGKTVYLIDELTEQKIDSTVVADGRFSFTGTAAQDALMAVRAKSSSWTTQFFNDGTPVSINLNDSTLKGSPQNERLTKINYEMVDPQGKIIYRGLRGKALHTRLEQVLKK